jgi:hypothetical protein
MQKSSCLSCDLVWIGATEDPGDRKLFEFRVLESVDNSNNVVLNMDLGNILSYDFKESVLGYKNFVYVAGPGDEEARALVKVYDGTEPTGHDRYEDYVDASDCLTTDEMTQRGVETLASKQGTQSLEFEFDTENQSEKYGTDFKLGDIVTVIDPYASDSGVELVDRITSVTTVYDTNGKTIKLGMGTAAPDLVSILKMDRKQNTNLRR